MQHIKPFNSIDVSLPSFQRCLKKSPHRAQFEAALIDLLSDPIPGALGFKKLKGYRNPALYSIVVGGNHAYKISMEIRDGVAIMRRAGTHKEIDDMETEMPSRLQVAELKTREAKKLFQPRIKTMRLINRQLS